jgi:hypothetical protein
MAGNKQQKNTLQADMNCRKLVGVFRQLHNLAWNVFFAAFTCRSYSPYPPYRGTL